MGSKMSMPSILGDASTDLGSTTFALAGGSYAIVRTIQTFPGVGLPPGTTVVPPGEKRQALTIVFTSAEGCKVLLD